MTSKISGKKNISHLPQIQILAHCQLLPTFTYSEMSLHRCLGEISCCQSFIRGFTINGGVQATSALAFIVTLKSPCCTSNFKADSDFGIVKESPPSIKGFPLLTSQMMPKASRMSCCRSLPSILSERDQVSLLLLRVLWWYCRKWRMKKNSRPKARHEWMHVHTRSHHMMTSTVEANTSTTGPC
jgi:hypothetical protein